METQIEVHVLIHSFVPDREGKLRRKGLVAFKYGEKVRLGKEKKEMRQEKK